MRLVFGYVLAGLLAIAPVSRAQVAAPSTPEEREAEARAAYANAVDTGTKGPADVGVAGQATIHIGPYQVWAGQPAASRLMRAYGNVPGAALVGLVMVPGQPWTAVASWVPDGYVKDDEARDFDAADILSSLRQATESDNKDRVARGFPEVEIGGWLQPPQYDIATHRLTWALSLRDKGSTDPNPDVNYNTRVLGRDGYLVLNMLTDTERFARDRPTALTLLDGTSWQAGKRYEDFNGSTDRVATYGLAALIGVVAAKKLGLLALAGVFLLKFAKVGLLALLGVGAVLRRMLRRRPKPAATADLPGPEPLA